MNADHSPARPFILVANDDGVYSPGLLALKQALEQLGDVVVLAPDRNRTAAGHSKTMHKPLRVQKVTLADGSDGYAGSGSPSDCVALALLGLFKRKVDLVVSGINLGANMGHDILYSGTVSAAMEGIIFAVPSLAVSLDTHGPADPDGWLAAAQFATQMAQRVLSEGLPPGVLLNINVPNRPARELRGVAITRLGQRVYRDELVERHDPRGRPYYWIGGDVPGGEPHDGTDIGAVHNGLISVTPVHLDLTEYRFMERLQQWNLSLETG